MFRYLSLMVYQVDVNFSKSCPQIVVEVTSSTSEAETSNSKIKLSKEPSLVTKRSLTDSEIEALNKGE